MKILDYPCVPESQAEVIYIPEGVPGIKETLRHMGRLIQQGKRSMKVRDKALSLIRNLPQKAYRKEVEALHEYVRDKMRYCQDTTDIEVIQTADASLRLMAGDCDDKAVLLCSLLESIGHKTRLVAIGFEPGIFEHVLLDTLIGPYWVSCEATENVDVGWEPESGVIKCKLLFYN
jgi:transglutaminase-like putative cysteine protease